MASEDASAPVALPLSDNCYQCRFSVRMAQHQIEFGFDIAGRRRKLLEIKQPRIEQMRRHRITERGQHRGANVGNFFFQLLDQSFDAGTLEIWLRAAEVTGNDRKLCLS